LSSRPWRFAASLAAAGALVLSAVPAFGDNIKNDIGATGSNVVTLSGSSVSTTISFDVQITGSPAGCDVSAGNPAVYNVVLTAPAAGANASVSTNVSSISFAACGVAKPVTFTATSAGTKDVSLVYVSGPSLNANPAKFTLTVNAPTNTPPVVTVGGVTATAYEFGSVPAAVCNVTDAEDAAESAAPSLSAITGPLSSYGLGSQTATCSYTDGGGLSDSDSVTYTIVDTTNPVLSTPGDTTVEATGPTGAVVTWSISATDNVEVDGSPSCEPASGSTFPLGDTLVSCSVTDVAGNTDSGSFTVTVEDTGAPSITAPADITTEATSAAGAVVTFDDPVVSDTVDTTLTPACDPASGSTFPLGDTEITCSVTDDSGNSSEASFTITVQDTTPPLVADHGNESAEATGPSGAAVTFTEPTASDLVDGATDVTCDAESGDTFPIGETTVSCSSTDVAGNTGYNSFLVTVVDTTPPVIDAHDDVTAEATGPSGANVVYTTPGATDLVDGAVAVGCIPSSPVLVAVGDSQLVTCTATDVAGNAAESTFTLYVVDTTPPVIDPHADVTAEATGPTGAEVGYTNPGATDIVDGSVATDCTPTSGVLVAVDGSQLVTCTATDVAGNSSQSTFTLNVVDTTAPTLDLPGNINAQATSASGAVVSYTATGSDLVDGTVPADCTPASGSTFAPGMTTVSCTASDSRSNTSDAGTFTVTVSFAFNGFFAPVDNNGVLNTIKGGQSVPLKWAIPNGSGGFISSLSVVSGLKQASFTCTAGAPTDDVEATSTGGTSLRYDTTANQYIYNWQSPKGAGSCYKVTVYLTDGTSKSALFKTK